MIQGKTLRDSPQVRLAEALGVDLAHARVKLWLDPPFRNLLAAADVRGQADSPAAAAVWNVERLLHPEDDANDLERELARPDALVSLGCCADADSLLVDQHKIIFTEEDEKDEKDHKSCRLVEFDFWGK